jgi:very-short-patch-repair endonuclease
MAQQWKTPPRLWAKLRPLAQQMRREPTPAEHKLWQRLRRNQIHGVRFRRQHSIERFIVDFYCARARLIVEVDGPVHQYTQQEDAIRQAFLEQQGFQVLRFTNLDVFNNLDAVVEQIAAAVRERA